MIAKILAFVTAFISMIICVKICKINLSEQDKFDENGNLIKKGEGFNALGWGTWVVFYIDSLMSGIESIADVIGVTLGNIIFFAIGFYIIYGIMSAAGASKNDEYDRRNKAAWINVVLSLITAFLIY